MKGISFPSEAGALLLSRTRKYADILLRDGQIKQAEIQKRIIDELCCGDYCIHETREKRDMVSAGLARKNLFARSLGNTSKKIAANLDALCIISAPPPLYNTEAIDRMLLVADAQKIPCYLVLNKADLLADKLADKADGDFLLAPYQGLCEQLILCSTCTADGMKAFQHVLEHIPGQLIAFAGVSGVGKSSILQALLPDVAFRMAGTSSKTGQGRQTTTQGQGYVWENSSEKTKIVIDLPGIQSFGVSQFEDETVRALFTDFHEYAHACAFSNCSHIGEQDCGVKAALEAGKLAASRYISYVKIIEEIERHRPY